MRCDWPKRKRAPASYCTLPATYTQKGKKRYRYYVCHTAQKRSWQNCSSKSIPAAEIETYVVDQIREIGQSPS
ncbi:zinc ribbon domain-containing protein [Rubinisphaera italica]|uniref:zinc ribbon domain-containing protein n=1 Tax=Rubinisphaera italica TaxID=2527969 RepID=UPI001F5E3C14|nr:zinc ribbon domain-containing protein [Rubinisphaera italica]